MKKILALTFILLVVWLMLHPILAAYMLFRLGGVIFIILLMDITSRIFFKKSLIELVFK